MNQQKRLILVSLLIILTITTGSVFYYRLNVTKTSQPKTIKSQQSTGAVSLPTQPPTSESIAIDKLLSETPFSLTQFEISYDYSKLVFQVGIFEPYEINYQAFLDWHQQNYPHVPYDKFNFTKSD